MAAWRNTFVPSAMHAGDPNRIKDVLVSALSLACCESHWSLGLRVVSIVWGGANEMAHRIHDGMNKRLDKHQLILARVSMSDSCPNTADRMNHELL